MKDQPFGSVKHVTVKSVSPLHESSSLDTLSVEEPLEITIVYGAASNRVQKQIAVTMRTPGNDSELALGFLFTEGIISSISEVASINENETECSSYHGNFVRVELIDGVKPQLANSERNFYTTSSCGVCGKGSIQSIKTVSPFDQHEKRRLNISTEIFYGLPSKLRASQSEFTVTGGVHASGLFTVGGDLICVREDVGRHNALDKIIGRSLREGTLPLDQRILLLSGRASFELIQKAAMAGISVVAAIGAPSSLAVELAKEVGITVIGFLKENRFNIYCSSENVSISSRQKESATQV
jgi:FdhD protein